MKQDALQRRIRGIIETALENDQDVVASWLAQQVIGEHQKIEGEDRDFWLACGGREIRASVQKAVNAYKISPNSGEDAQILLPGFRHLQKAYLTPRENEQTVVRVDRMTDPELRIKAADLQTMAAGCIEHAAEIVRYMATRRATA
jgi:hypothetical protein